MSRFNLKKSIADFADSVCKEVMSPNLRREIAREYADHIEDEVYRYVLGGMTEEEAFYMACENLGSPENYRSRLADVHNVPELLPEEIAERRKSLVWKSVGICFLAAVILTVAICFRWFLFEVLAFFFAVWFIVYVPAAVRVLCKRISFVRRLKKVCRQKGFSLHSTHFLWWLGWTRGKGSDFYVETPCRVYSVKLIGVISRKMHFLFKSRDEYAIRSFMFEKNFHVHAMVDSYKYEPKKKKPYDFAHKMPEEHGSKEIVPIILMNPLASDVASETLRGTERQQLADGDFVVEGFLYSGSGFIKGLSGIE